MGMRLWLGGDVNRIRRLHRMPVQNSDLRARVYVWFVLAARDRYVVWVIS